MMKTNDAILDEYIKLWDAKVIELQRNNIMLQTQLNVLNEQHNKVVEEIKKIRAEGEKE